MHTDSIGPRRIDGISLDWNMLSIRNTLSACIPESFRANSMLSAATLRGHSVNPCTRADMHLFIISFVDLLQSNYLLLLAILAFVYYACHLILRYITGSATHLKDPPGPRGVPIFGNEFQIPADKQWLTFHEWGQKYGEQDLCSTWIKC